MWPPDPHAGVRPRGPNVFGRAPAQRGPSFVSAARLPPGEGGGAEMEGKKKALTSQGTSPWASASATTTSARVPRAPLEHASKTA